MIVIILTNVGTNARQRDDYLNKSFVLFSLSGYIITICARADDSDVHNGKPQQLFHHGLHTVSFSASYLHFSRCIHQEASADIVIKRLIIPSSSSSSSSSAPSCVTLSPCFLNGHRPFKGDGTFFFKQKNKWLKLHFNFSLRPFCCYHVLLPAALVLNVLFKLTYLFIYLFIEFIEFIFV